MLNLVSFYLVKSAYTDFADKNTKLMMLTTKRASLSQLKRERDQALADQQKIEAGFVARERAVDFIVALEKLAADTGSSAAIKTVEGGSSPDTIGFKVEFLGVYAGLANFLARLEVFDYFISVSKMDVSESYDSVNKKSVLRATLDVKVLTI